MPTRLYFYRKKKYTHANVRAKNHVKNVCGAKIVCTNNITRVFARLPSIKGTISNIQFFKKTKKCRNDVFFFFFLVTITLSSTFWLPTGHTFPFQFTSYHFIVYIVLCTIDKVTLWLKLNLFSFESIHNNNIITLYSHQVFFL